MPKTKEREEAPDQTFGAPIGEEDGPEEKVEAVLSPAADRDEGGIVLLDLEKSLEERAQEIRTGKRVLPLPDGGVAILRIPTTKQVDDAGVQVSIAVWDLYKRGVPLLADLRNEVGSEVDQEKVDKILRDPERGWQQKVMDLEQAVSSSRAATLIKHTAEVQAEVERWKYLIKLCVETVDGKNWWQASEFGSYDDHPNTIVAAEINSGWWRFYGDAMDPNSLRGSSNGTGTGASAGDSVAASKAVLAAPGTPS